MTQVFQYHPPFIWRVVKEPVVVVQLQEPRKPVERVLPIWIHGCNMKLMIYLKYVSSNVFYQRSVIFFMLKDIVFDMDVSENRGTPKSSILIGFSITNHPFWGTPIFGNTHRLFLCACFLLFILLWGIVVSVSLCVLPCRPKELHFRPCDAQDTAQVFKTRPRVGGFEIRAGDTDYCLDTWNLFSWWICLGILAAFLGILGDD